MKNQAFNAYLFARVCISLATTILSVSIGWHLYQRTGDPFSLALVGLVQIAPGLLLFIVTGWVVDNFPRKTVLLLCAVAEVLIFTVLASVMSSVEFNLWSVYLLLFVQGVVSAFYAPALQAILPNIVSKEFFAKAVAISSSVWNTASTAGPFVSGLLIAWIDFNTYWLLVVLAILGLVFFARLPVLQQTEPSARGRSELLSGIRYIKNSPLLLGSMSIDLVIMLVASVMALLPVYVADVLKAGPEALGLLRAMPALGAVLIGVLLSRRPPMRNAGKLLFLSLLVFAISVLVFALSEALWLSMLALLVYGGSDMVSVNIRTTLMQIATPDALRGRVSAVNMLFISASNELGSFRAGSVAAMLGPVPAVVMGAAMAFGVVWGGYYLFPSIAKLDSLDEAESKAS
jgi:MFS family permease